MIFDIFFSICQVEIDGYLPREAVMLGNFFDQVRLADELGFTTAWVAENHLSTAVQQCGPHPIVPHFRGEVGLNTDILQLATHIYHSTQRIGVGSAIRNVLCNGGPLAHAESVRTFLSLAHANGYGHRKLHLGFAAGRFPFANAPYGIVPRNELETLLWPIVRGKIFNEALQIFLRALRGDTFATDDLAPTLIERKDVASEDVWQKALAIASTTHQIINHGEALVITPRWSFDRLALVPRETDLTPLELVIGSHDPAAQIAANTILPCGVFNLSITPAPVIEETHHRMQTAYHPAGGPWQRFHLPRTVLIFVDGDPAKSPSAQRTAARQTAQQALRAYWQAMEGTVNDEKIEGAIDNALCGNPDDIARQIKERFHPDDRLMLWFDFHNHDNDAVKRAMATFWQQVVPLCKATL